MGADDLDLVQRETLADPGERRWRGDPGGERRGCGGVDRLRRGMANLACSKCAGASPAADVWES
jgi:hypothetical protein